MVPNKLHYSLVVPVYNEDENLHPLRDNIIEAMSSIEGNYEVILVDDGSKDQSRSIIKEICQKHPQFRYLFFDRNHGQTAGFAAGFQAAEGDIVITMDADLQTDCRDIPLLLKHMDTHDAVVGYRMKREDSWSKRISSKIANGIRNKLSGEDIRDVGCPLKAMKREAAQSLKMFNGMHRFFPTLLKYEGYRVIEVGVNHFPRKHGESKYSMGNRAWRAFIDLLAVCWMKSRYLHYKVIESSKSS